MNDQERKQPRVLPEPPKTTPIEPIIAAEIMPKQGKAQVKSDVLGSYTGTPAQGTQPEQDADDL